MVATPNAEDSGFKRGNHIERQSGDAVEQKVNLARKDSNYLYTHVTPQLFGIDSATRVSLIWIEDTFCATVWVSPGRGRFLLDSLTSWIRGFSAAEGRQRTPPRPRRPA